METPWDDDPRAARRPGRADLHHAHASGPRGRRRRPRRRPARPVIQGRLDYAQCERVWGIRRLAGADRGVVPPQRRPAEVAEELIESGHVFADFVRFAWNPTLVEPGDEIDGWRVHRDARARGRPPLRSQRDGVLIAGDTLLTPITPAIGLYPESRPDPLGDYIETLRRARRARAARSRTAGTARRSRDPAARCARDRSRTTTSGSTIRRRRSAAEPRTGYDVSHDVFGREPAGDPAPVRRRGDALAPRAARRPRPRRPARGRPERRLYCALLRWTSSRLVPAPLPEGRA